MKWAEAEPNERCRALERGCETDSQEVFGEYSRPCPGGKQHQAPIAACALLQPCTRQRAAAGTETAFMNLAALTGGSCSI